MTLYYFQERVWFNLEFPTSRLRHILKTITWRIVGTIDTMFIAWLLTDDISIGLKIGAIEIVTKMVLYFGHERAWYLSKWGIEGLNE